MKGNVMTRLLLFVVVGFVLINWLAGGHDDITDPPPVYPTTYLERTQ